MSYVVRVSTFKNGMSSLWNRNVEKERTFGNETRNGGVHRDFTQCFEIFIGIISIVDFTNGTYCFLSNMKITLTETTKTGTTKSPPKYEKNATTLQSRFRTLPDASCRTEEENEKDVAYDVF